MLQVTTSILNGHTAWRLRHKKPTLHIIQTNNKQLFDKIYQECLEAENDFEKLISIKNKYGTPNHNDIDKYIYTYGKKYRIIKNNKYYGTYDTVEEARIAKKIFIENYWDETLISYQKKRWKWENRSDKNRYIYPVNDKYVVIKNSEYYGTYNTLEEAIEERNLLIKYDWDYQSMCESEGVL